MAQTKGIHTKATSLRKLVLAAVTHANIPIGQNRPIDWPAIMVNKCVIRYAQKKIQWSELSVFPDSMIMDCFALLEAMLVLHFPEMTYYKPLRSRAHKLYLIVTANSGSKQKL